ncbi:MAG: hypothetical protein SGPRY_003693 [Prymnesium sp.]
MAIELTAAVHAGEFVPLAITLRQQVILLLDRRMFEASQPVSESAAARDSSSV